MSKRSLFTGLLTLIIPIVITAENVPTASYKVYDSETIVYSNEPELITEPGMIMDQIQKSPLWRVLYYHKNGAADTLAIVLSVKNESPVTAAVRYVDGLGGPLIEGVYAGHIASRQFLEKTVNQEIKTLTIPAYATRVLVKHQVKPNAVISGIIRIEKQTTDTLRIKLNVIDPKYESCSLFNAPVLDTPYQIGYYPESVIHQEVRFVCDKKLLEIPIGSAPYVKEKNSGQTLKGNYGVFYDITLTLTNPHARYQRVCLHISPIAGITRTALIINDRLVETEGGKKLKKLEPENIYEISLAPLENKQVRIVTMPQAGSFYPVNIIVNAENVNVERKNR